MKYEIELKKVETISVCIDAESPQQALDIAKASELGFQAEYITEILKDSECGQSFTVYGRCVGG